MNQNGLKSALEQSVIRLVGQEFYKKKYKGTTTFERRQERISQEEDLKRKKKSESFDDKMLREIREKKSVKKRILKPIHEEKFENSSFLRKKLEKCQNGDNIRIILFEKEAKDLQIMLYDKTETVEYLKGHLVATKIEDTAQELLRNFTENILLKFGKPKPSCLGWSFHDPKNGKPIKQIESVFSSESLLLCFQNELPNNNPELPLNQKDTETPLTFEKFRDIKGIVTNRFRSKSSMDRSTKREYLEYAAEHLVKLSDPKHRLFLKKQLIDDRIDKIDSEDFDKEIVKVQAPKRNEGWTGYLLSKTNKLPPLREKKFSKRGEFPKIDQHFDVPEIFRRDKELQWRNEREDDEESSSETGSSASISLTSRDSMYLTRSKHTWRKTQKKTINSVLNGKNEIICIMEESNSRIPTIKEAEDSLSFFKVFLVSLLSEQDSFNKESLQRGIKAEDSYEKLTNAKKVCDEVISHLMFPYLTVRPNGGDLQMPGARKAKVLLDFGLVQEIRMEYLFSEREIFNYLSLFNLLLRRSGGEFVNVLEQKERIPCLMGKQSGFIVRICFGLNLPVISCPEGVVQLREHKHFLDLLSVVLLKSRMTTEQWGVFWFRVMAGNQCLTIAPEEYLPVIDRAFRGTLFPLGENTSITFLKVFIELLVENGTVKKKDLILSQDKFVEFYTKLSDISHKDHKTVIKTLQGTLLTVQTL